MAYGFNDDKSKAEIFNSFKVERIVVASSVSIAAKGTVGTPRVDVSEQGYKALGIVGSAYKMVAGSNDLTGEIRTLRLDTETQEIVWTFRNPESTAGTLNYLWAYVLYVKE